MVTRTGLGKSETANVAKFIQLLEQEGITVVNVILFGSHARGKAHAESDIDLAVVSPQFGRDTTEEMMRLRKIALKVDSHIEPVPFCPEDLNDKFSTLAQEVKQYGIEVEI